MKRLAILLGILLVLCGAAMRVGTGLLLDRLWAPLVALPILSLPALACVLLAGEGVTLPLAYVSALVVGLAAGAETDLIACLAARCVGALATALPCNHTSSHQFVSIMKRQNRSGCAGACTPGREGRKLTFPRSGKRG